MTCALCHNYTACQFAVCRFRIGFIEASDGFLTCPLSWGVVEDTRGTFADIVTKQYQERRRNNGAQRVSAGA